METFRIHFRGKYIFRQRVTFVVVLESRKKSFASRRISCPYPANANHFFYFLLFDINRRKQSYQTRFIKEQKSGFETVCIYLGKIALGEIGLFGALVGTVRSDLEIDQIAKIVQNWSKPTSGYMIRFQKNGFSFLVIFAQKSPFSQNRSDRPRFKNGLIFTFLLVKLSDWK